MTDLIRICDTCAKTCRTTGVYATDAGQDYKELCARYERKRMTQWDMLFGTPERAAETVKGMCVSMESCTYCPLYAAGVDFCESDEGDGVAEWLESEVRDG